MKNILTRGGVEFLAVLLGITLSFSVDEWKQDKEIEKRLKSDYINIQKDLRKDIVFCLLYTSPSPRDRQKSRMPSSA